MTVRSRIFSATTLLVLAALGSLYSPAAFAQASQVPPGRACFQATTGVSGMIGITGAITGGSGGAAGTYAGVALTGGSGSGATANITVAGGAVTSIALLNPGVNYVVGDTLSATSGSIGNVAGFSVPVASISINSSLAGGSVGMYVPGTLTIKQTWQNAGQTILNQNPVALDANGCANIYGTGTYRQIVYDNLGDVVWDQPTTVFTANPFWAGLATGTRNAIVVSDAAFSGADGQSIQFLSSLANNGPTTLNPGSGAIPVLKNSSAGVVPLTGGEIAASTLQTVTYSTIYSSFILNFTSDAVEYGASQSLTSAQKQQAQANIFLLPTVQIFTSGTAATYTTPTGATFLEVTICGGGAGGGAAGATVTPGSAGSSSSFGSLATTTGGAASTTTGAGGTATVSSPAIPIVTVTGGIGQSGNNTGSAVTFTLGGSGGVSPRGGSGPGGGGGLAGSAAAANSCSGGGGAGSNDNAGLASGSGGGAGGYAEFYVPTPSATYSYTVGPGGAGATNGGAGAAGIIIVKEHYGS